MKKTFNIKGMTCASCQSHVQKAVDKLEGINNCNVNLLQNNMFVEFDEKICSIEKIEKAVIFCFTSRRKNIRFEK